jgi:hypothetical protein
VVACSMQPALVFWLKVAATLEATYATMLSLARWALSVLSLFCHRRCIAPLLLVTPPLANPRLPLHSLGSLLCRRLQQQLWPLHSRPVLATMCLFLMLCLRILHRRCHSLGSRIKLSFFYVLRLSLCAAAGFTIDDSADNWDTGAPVHLQSQTQGVIGGLYKWQDKCCPLEGRRWWLLCRLFSR